MRNTALQLTFGNVRNWILLKCYKNKGVTPIAETVDWARSLDMKFASFIVLLVLAASPAAAQTVDTSTSQVCSQDPTYCSDTGCRTKRQTTTGSGAGSSASSGGSGGGGSGRGSSGGGASATPAFYPMRHAEMVLPWTRGAPATDLVRLSDHYWEGELSAHPFWQESWVDVQPILQVAFASALKISPIAGAARRTENSGGAQVRWE